MHAAVAEALPGCPQVVFLDEPGLATLLRPGFPLAAETALDLVSGALAAIEPSAMGGVHHCGEGDEVAILASGPAILSLPVRPGLVDVAGHLGRYLDGGGWIAWGAVPTDRPVGLNADRPWRELAELWCTLVQAGCPPERLRDQAVITPACGLGLHGEDQARTVLQLVANVAGPVSGPGPRHPPLHRRRLNASASPPVSSSPSSASLRWLCSLARRSGASATRPPHYGGHSMGCLTAVAAARARAGRASRHP